MSPSVLTPDDAAFEVADDVAFELEVLDDALLSDPPHPVRAIIPNARATTANKAIHLLDMDDFCIAVLSR